jgi:hypothetical protein
MTGELEQLEKMGIKEIKEFSLNHADYWGKFKALRDTKITPTNFAGVVAVADSFTSEQSVVVENSFKNALEARNAFDEAWRNFSSVAKSGLFMPLKVSVDEMHRHNLQGYMASIQATAYSGMLAIRLSDAVHDSYAVGGVLDEEMKQNILKMQEKASAVAKQLENLVDLLKLKESK